MLLSDCSTFSISFLLVFLVVAMVGVEKIAYLPNFVLEMDRLNLRIVKFAICAGVTNGSKEDCSYRPLSFSRNLFILNRIVSEIV